MKNVKVGAYVNNTTKESFDFNFATDLAISDKVTFVRTVVDTLVDDTNYDFILKDTIFNLILIKMMTDININELFYDAENKEFNLDDIEQFLEETNVVDIIKVNAKDGLIDELNEGVNKSIEYKTGIHVNPLAEAAASLIKTIENKLDSFDLSGAMELAQNFNQMNGEWTPENIVKAYMNTDVHKNNMIDLEEAKKTRNKINDETKKIIDDNKKKK